MLRPRRSAGISNTAEQGGEGQRICAIMIKEDQSRSGGQREGAERGFTTKARRTRRIRTIDDDSVHHGEAIFSVNERGH
jgi:hypothetical protein